MTKTLIRRLAELAHLTPDQIVVRLGDPLQRPITPKMMEDIPYDLIADRSIVFVRDDMSRWDPGSYLSGTTWTERRHHSFIQGDYSVWSIIGHEYRTTPGIGLPSWPNH